MDLKSGQKLLHYRLTAKMGEGGMGAVYRAMDSKLGREVALKVLPIEMASDQQRLERFQREARAVAALNHPNIVTIHSVEESDGVHFLTMELVAGDPLNRLIPEDGFDIERLLDISIPLTNAIAAAHDRGIVHRDLKPANVMVGPDGQVKILDFGLAKLQPEEVSAEEFTAAPTLMMTREGIVMGTAPYMSPEQAKGTGMDHRTDIFSLGIMLYEMACGRRPFLGETAVELVSAILKDTPRPVTEIKVELPNELGRIIGSCLEKGPKERIQTASEVYSELKSLRQKIDSDVIRPATEITSNVNSEPANPHSTVERADVPGSRTADRNTASGVPKAKAIAVLPFTNMSAEADNEFFADGVTEDILARLSTIKDLRVISRTSVMTYKGATKSIRTIAQELEVGTVLEGSVRRAGEKVRIVAQLIDAATDGQLWAGTYDRDLDDIFAIQSEVAENIAAALEAELAPSVIDRMRRRPTDNMDAYNLFLRGRQNIWTLEVVRIGEGLVQLEKAIELDPYFAAAHAMIAIARVLTCYWAGGAGSEELPLGMDSAERALELDGNSALALAARGTIRFHYDWDWVGAERDLKRSLSLDPNEALAHFFLGVMYFICERFEEALAAAEDGTKLDPHSAFQYTQIGYCMWLLGRDQEAELVLVSAIERHPSDFNLHNVMGVLLRRVGRFEEAADQFLTADRLAGGHPFLKASEALCLRLAGNRKKANRVLSEIDADQDDPRINYDTEMMLAVARSGDAKVWLRNLQVALEQRSVMAPWFIRVVWESVGDPAKSYAAEDFRPLPGRHPEVKAIRRQLWPEEYSE